jgi:hypothetical protein
MRPEHHDFNRRLAELSHATTNAVNWLRRAFKTRIPGQLSAGQTVELRVLRNDRVLPGTLLWIGKRGFLGAVTVAVLLPGAVTPDSHVQLWAGCHCFRGTVRYCIAWGAGYRVILHSEGRRPAALNAPIRPDCWRPEASKS